ncbi:MAG TPA: FAD-dependent oxidoreductase [Solirubrobacterales bacterium]|nr:FAD-dependent oxidoreductase [Solirubrobacterales bacterium]
MSASAGQSPDGFDLVVVGGGAAGLAAAASASAAGASVVVLEVAEELGGTTAKSSGGYWIPNNFLLREKGKEDPKADALRHMAVLAFPGRFDPEDEWLGLERRDFDLIDRYYEAAPRAIDTMRERGDLQSMEMAPFKPELEGLGPWHVTDWDRRPYGRILAPQRLIEPDAASSNPSAAAMRRQGGKQGDGAELVRQLAEAARARGTEIRLRHRVVDVLKADDAVVGVIAEGPDGTVEIGGRHGVVFATGGFSHNDELAAEYLRGPIVGSAAVMTNQGTFVEIARELGAELGNMAEAWWGELALEPLLDDPCPDDFIGFQFGDSALMVNRLGRRVVNEKLMYNERTKVHFDVDENGELPNRLLFMIYDSAVAESTLEWPSRMPVPYPGEPTDHVIVGETLEDLAIQLDRRLEALGEDADGVRIDADFAAELGRTVERFNGFAASGVDEDFGRGKSISDINFNPPARAGNDANPTMFPLSAEGPYYAIIIGAGTMDTKGGPRIDPDGRVLRPGGEPIAGLFGAGNCISSPTGEAYWGGGSTLGPALTFGLIAGATAVGAAAVGAPDGP